MLRLTAPRVHELDEAARAMTGRHLVDLLALAVEADPRTLGDTTGRLADCTTGCDPITGLPVMSAIPISVKAV